ncbi:MAG: hypothetical protein A3F70_07175 [Acidobacteria bacterium RIFCSPLOWO2_12_FULL_67_14]|nr:MAG: hypothetical protein A3H29_19030 [Acidobacteria bacterium RIFCSPLOWO2_02_FULL_67_21]OFW36234.1 MAG: hypothetical protein A3F70_07175 [Acidobacteria bacterium RIFCSPLOWO2_12_FULL_67_14]
MPGSQHFPNQFDGRPSPEDVAFHGHAGCCRTDCRQSFPPLSDDDLFDALGQVAAYVTGYRHDVNNLESSAARARHFNSSLHRGVHRRQCVNVNEDASESIHIHDLPPNARRDV